MGFFDFLGKKDASSVPQSDARKMVFAHRIEELRGKLKEQPDSKKREEMVHGFLWEFFYTFFGVNARANVDAIAQIEAATPDLKIRNRATSLFKRWTQYEKMGMSLGETETKEFLSDCEEILAIF